MGVHTIAAIADTHHILNAYVQTNIESKSISALKGICCTTAFFLCHRPADYLRDNYQLL